MDFGAKDFEFIMAMTQIAVSEGDTVYQDKHPDMRCLYKVDNTPACMIGKALHACGESLEDTWDGGGGMMAGDVLAHLGYHEYVALAANQAQRAQDDGQTWGVAFEAFKHTLEKQLKNEKVSTAVNL